MDGMNRSVSKSGETIDPGKFENGFMLHLESNS